MLLLLGKSNPSPTAGPSAWLVLAHWAPSSFFFGVADGPSSTDSVIAVKYRDEGLGATFGEAGTVGNPGVELLVPDVRLVFDGVRYPKEGGCTLRGVCGVNGISMSAYVRMTLAEGAGDGETRPSDPFKLEFVERGEGGNRRESPEEEDGEEVEETQRVEGDCSGRR